MKLVVFAHNPPPHHGQSYMVQLMLEGFGGDHRKKKVRENPGAGQKYGVACYHVNARLSRNLEEVGELRGQKVLLLLRFCVAAIWCRFRYGAKTLYYIPAPGKKSALLRDWMVMFLCRPFFPRIILHWHAAGLAKWLETVVQIRGRAVTYKFLKQADLSIVLSKHNRGDAEKLLPKQIVFVPNGIPDPCPDFEKNVLPRRLARAAARKKLLSGENLTTQEKEKCGGDSHLFKVLFLAHCTREKGLFDTLDAVALANKNLADTKSPLRIELSVAGEFVSAEAWNFFQNRIKQADLQIEIDNTRRCCVSYKNFVAGEEKSRLFVESDCFCFPSYHYAESFGLVLIEAMAFGMQIVTTRWRSIPELFPQNYPGLVEVRSPEQVAAALLFAMANPEESLREMFLKEFTIEKYLQNLANAFHDASAESEVFAQKEFAIQP
jgi:glycosyltransferase involved in cell wall biosynthesis